MHANERAVIPYLQFLFPRFTQNQLPLYSKAEVSQPALFRTLGAFEGAVVVDGEDVSGPHEKIFFFLAGKKVILGTKFKRCVQHHELRTTGCYSLGGFVQSNLSKPCAIPSITFLRKTRVEYSRSQICLMSNSSACEQFVVVMKKIKSV